MRGKPHLEAIAMIVHRTKQRMSAEEFLLSDHKGYELVDGYMREKNMGAFSSKVGLRIILLLTSRFDWQKWGEFFDAECGYQCWQNDPRRVRKPDISFVRHNRLPDGRTPEGWMPIPPDFAIEVMSKNDTLPEVEEKVQEYLDVMVPWVWIVDPKQREVHMHRPGQSPQCLADDDELCDDAILPGFACRASELFPPE